MMEKELQYLINHGIEFIVMIASAILVGFLIGFERQRKGKSVGILTSILVALGSMLFVHGGVILTRLDHLPGDTTRIGSMIVSGIGFIGAGAIIRSKYSISGLASAASIWSLGALGILIGWGYPITAILSAAIIFFLLRMVPLLEHHLFQQQFCMHLDIKVKHEKLPVLRDFLRNHQISLADSMLTESDGELTLSINECGIESRTGILTALYQLDGVVDVRHHSC
ncbi:MAG: MgtC/SapB family protein [Candidatus Marinimicrobia bacterium]|nr:MgtC/SapB family protein [Candidatus Neomarinimicrobiota bacterium]